MWFVSVCANGSRNWFACVQLGLSQVAQNNNTTPLPQTPPTPGNANGAAGCAIWTAATVPVSVAAAAPNINTTISRHCFMPAVLGPVLASVQFRLRCCRFSTIGHGVTDASDTPLVERCRAGDDRAFDALMARYQKPVLNFVYRLLGDAAEAEDVAQDVFVRAYRHLAEFDPRRSFSTWLFALAHNAAVDRLRYQRRRPTAPLEDAVAASPGRSPFAEAANRELAAQIAAAIQSLPTDQRTAIVLAAYHGLPTAEIAAIMNCSVKSVEARLYRAKQTLRKKLRGFF